MMFETSSLYNDNSLAKMIGHAHQGIKWCFSSMKNMKCHSKKDSAQQIDAYIILLSSFLGSLADICNKFSFASCQTFNIVFHLCQPLKITFMRSIFSEISYYSN